MSAAERGLKLLLRIIGITALPAIVAVLMPHSWLACAVSYAEPGTPVRVLVSYLARVLSVFYVMFGVFMLIFATDPRRYAAPIRVLAVVSVLGPFVLLIHAVPAIRIVSTGWFFWFVACDITIAAALGVLVLLLQRRIGQHGRRNRAPE